jgi:hypothetical protein
MWRRAVAMVAMAAMAAAPGALAEEDADEGWIPVPFRVRNQTFPTLLVMGFSPRPAYALPEGAWALEVNASQSNNFQHSKNVESYLRTRPGNPQPLSGDDLAAIVAMNGDRFYIDGEITVIDVGVHYGLTERLGLAVRVPWFGYSGGFMDGMIYGFHDTFGLGQAGRDVVADDQFQVLVGFGDEVYVTDGAPTSGGFGDPVATLHYTFPGRLRGWVLGLEGGLKAPIADNEVNLSSGSWDVGLQLNAQRQWRRHAVVLNLAWVVPGEFRPEGFEPATLPSLNASWLIRVGHHTSAVVQALFSENIFREATDTPLSELEFQVTLGAKFDLSFGTLGVGVTENVFNFDNTPDLALHLSYSRLFD